MPIDVSKLAESGYRVVSSIESWGELGTMGVVILVKLPGDPPSDEECSVFFRAAETCKKHLEGVVRSRGPWKEDFAEVHRQLVEAFGEGRAVYVRQTPNEYCSEPYCCAPWLRVTTAIGDIKIGWRKRVIVIDWSDSDIGVTAEMMFPEEDVTKCDRRIDAWGYKKAAEYLERLHTWRPADSPAP